MTGRYDKLLTDWPDDVPFERIVRQRLEAFDDLIAQGVTWPSIAAALARAGITRKNGGQLSGRQVNAVYLRNRDFADQRAKTTVDLEPLGIETNDPAPVPPIRRPSSAPAPGGNGSIANRLAEARTFCRQVNEPYED